MTTTRRSFLGGMGSLGAVLRAEYHNGWQFPQVTGAEASAG